MCPRSEDRLGSIASVDPTVILIIRGDNIQRIQRETTKDQSLLKLSCVIKSDWPHLKSQMDDSVRPYFSFRDELSVHNGLIFKGNRLVIPLLLRREMLHIAHGGHVGLEASLCQLREAIYWPGTAADAKVLIGQK